MDSLAALLESRIMQRRAQIAALTTGIEQMRTSRSLSTADDEHDPEGSMVSLDQARDAALLRHAQSALDELRAAGQRLRDGCYGWCERCGTAIPIDRLAVRPEARCCVPCSPVEPRT